MLKDRKINLVSRLKADPVSEALSKRRLLLVLPFAVFALGILGFELLFLFVLMPANTAIYDEANDYMNDPQVMQDYNRAGELARENEALQQQRDKLGSIFTSIESYTEMDRHLYETVMNRASGNAIAVSALDYDRTAGTISMSGIAPDVHQAAEFVSSLQRSGEFYYVFYYGYAEAEMPDSEGNTYVGQAQARADATAAAYERAAADANAATLAATIAPEEQRAEAEAKAAVAVAIAAQAAQEAESAARALEEAQGTVAAIAAEFQGYAFVAICQLQPGATTTEQDAAQDMEQQQQQDADADAQNALNQAASMLNEEGIA